METKKRTPKSNNDIKVLNDKLKTKEKELNDLKKKIKDLENSLLNKDKEIEKLKESLKNKEEEGKKNLKKSIKDIFEQENIKDNVKPWDNLNENINRIIDNYLTENDILKQELKTSKETVNYLKEKLIKNKKEIIDKEQNILEIKNENINKIEDLINKYELKLFEINNKYNFLKDLYDEFKEEKKN